MSETGSFDEAVEPGPRGGDREDQAVALLGFQSAGLAAGELGMRMARRTCVAGLVQGTDRVSIACGSSDWRDSRSGVVSDRTATRTR